MKHPVTKDLQDGLNKRKATLVDTRKEAERLRDEANTLFDQVAKEEEKIRQLQWALEIIDREFGD